MFRSISLCNNIQLKHIFDKIGSLSKQNVYAGTLMKTFATINDRPKVELPYQKALGILNSERDHLPYPDRILYPYDKDIITKVNNQIENKNFGRLFSVIHICGKQYKVTEEDVIIVQGYWAPDIGDRIRLEKVLLVGGRDFSLIGKPLLPRDLIRVEATVIEKTLSHTMTIFRMIRRKDYRRTYFHRQPYTMLRINLIEIDSLVDEIKDVEGLRPSAI